MSDAAFVGDSLRTSYQHRLGTAAGRGTCFLAFMTTCEMQGAVRTQVCRRWLRSGYTVKIAPEPPDTRPLVPWLEL